MAFSSMVWMPNTSLAAADFRAMVANEFPLVEEHQPLEPAFETFGPGNSSLALRKVEFIEGAISPRFFFIAPDETELVQLQRDRLFFNWRQTAKREAYPRYPHVRERLGAQLDRLEKWVERGKLGSICPTQCEALYVNKIPLCDAEGTQCGLSYIFPWFDGLAGTTEDGSFSYRRRLFNDDNEPVARLFFNMRYGSDDEGKREVQLFLTVRGRPQEPTLAACLGFIDGARAMIVHTFSQITSKEAHKMWERKE